VKSLLALLLVVAFAPPEAFAQANNREVRPHVVDPSGLGIKATVQITSEANQYHNFLATDNQGHAVAQRLPFGNGDLAVSRSGFAELSQSVEIRSSVPTELTILLKLTTLNQSVVVNAADTLIDPDQAGCQVGGTLTNVVDLTDFGGLFSGNAIGPPRNFRPSIDDPFLRRHSQDPAAALPRSMSTMA